MLKKLSLSSLLAAGAFTPRAHAVEAVRFDLINGKMLQMASAAGLSLPGEQAIPRAAEPAARPTGQNGVAVFEKEYTYPAGEGDSKLVCREAAMAILKREVIEEMGVAVISVSEDKRSSSRGKNGKEEVLRLDKDQIVVASGGSVKAEILQERWDGRTYWVKARLQADPAEVKKNVDGFLSAWREKGLDSVETQDGMNRALDFARAKTFAAQELEALGFSYYRYDASWTLSVGEHFHVVITGIDNASDTPKMLLTGSSAVKFKSLDDFLEKTDRLNALKNLVAEARKNSAHDGPSNTRSTWAFPTPSGSDPYPL